MNRILLIFTLLAANVLNLQGQTNPIELKFAMLQGDSISFDLEGQFAGPVLNYAPAEGYTSRMPLGSNQYAITYYAPADFVGSIVFSYKSSFLDFPAVISEVTTVYVDVVRSTVIASDDFVDIDSADPIELFPLANDSSSTNSLELTGVAQAMFGSAETTDSNTIIYTPGESILDYLVYSTRDSLGTSASATYYISRDIPVMEYEVEQHSISNTQRQYIFFGNETYVLTEGSTLGEVSSAGSNVYVYEPFSDSQGLDSLTFTDADGNEKEVVVSIFDSYVDAGIVRDDRFFTPKGSEITFDVFANDFDNSLVVVEANSSEELTYLGSGQFSYTPSASFTGVKKFIYSATNGVTTEEGQIDIIVANFVPKDQGTYAFNVLEGSTLSLMYDVPLSGYIFDVLAAPSFGTVEITYGDSLATVCGDIVGNVAVVYTPYAGYVGADEFDIQYCPENGSEECELIKTTVTIEANAAADCNCVDDCVWSGDANNDGLVNILDVLTVGRSIGASGAARTTASEWVGTESVDWDGATILGNNHKYADTDGDGLVTTADVNPIISNYNKIHSYAENNVLAVKDYPFFIIPQNPTVQPGELAVFDIITGTEQYPVVDLQGIAFAINLSADFVDSSTVKLTFLEDKYLVKQSPFLNVVHQPVDGIIHAAGIRTNGNGSSGYGLVATLEFIVEDEIDGVKVPQRLRSAGAGEGVDLSVLITDVVIEDGSGYQFAVADASSSVSIDVDVDELESISLGLDVYPNPASEYISIAADEASQVVVTDAMGRAMYMQSVAGSPVGTLIVDVADWPVGSYTVTLTTNTEVKSQLLQIVR